MKIIDIAGPPLSIFIEVVEEGDCIAIVGNRRPSLKRSSTAASTSGEVLHGVSIHSEMSVDLDGEIEALFNSLK